MDIKNKDENSSINDYKFIFKIKDEGDLKATVILQYKDIKIKGFRIVRSKYDNNDQNLWLQVPSYRTGNLYHKMFFIDNDETWKQLEEKILDAYKKESEKYYKKKFGLNHQEIAEPNISDDENIPF